MSRSRVRVGADPVGVHTPDTSIYPQLNPCPVTDAEPLHHTTETGHTPSHNPSAINRHTERTHPTMPAATPAPALAVAHHILSEHGPMSATKLHHLLYYVQAWHLAWDGSPAFDTEGIVATPTSLFVPELDRVAGRGDQTVYATDLVMDLHRARIQHKRRTRRRSFI